MVRRLFVLVFGIVYSAISLAEVEITSVVAQQRYPWNDIVDIEVSISGSSDELADIECVFSAKNIATETEIEISHISQKGDDEGSGMAWKRHFVWDAKDDVGAVKIEELELAIGLRDVNEDLGGVQLWQGGPIWAVSNVGSKRADGSGYYFWWGDIIGYYPRGGTSIINGRSGVVWVNSSGKVTGESPFRYSVCPTSCYSTSRLISEGYIDATGKLTSDHDAATKHLGMPWRMPTEDEFSALLENCDLQFSDDQGGMIVKGRGEFSANSIFLPAAGDGYDAYLAFEGTIGYYWSSSGKYLCFDKDGAKIYQGAKYYSQSVRPVRNSVVISDVSISTKFPIDCRDGDRISDRIERIVFSPKMETSQEGAISVLKINGEDVVRSSEDGIYEWMPTQDGTYEFTHDVFVDGKHIGTTMTATFIVSHITGLIIDKSGMIVGFSEYLSDPLNIPNYVTAIGASAFSGCKSLSSVTIPNNIDSIGSSAFSGCSSLSEVHISDLAKWCSISFADLESNPCFYAHHLFLDGDEITKLVVPDSVESICAYTFSGCSAVTSITIPESVNVIGASAFYGCGAIEAIATQGKIDVIEESAFSGCDSIREIIGWQSGMPNNVERITISDNLTSIEQEAFCGCASLSSLTIPDSVVEIGDRAFWGCENINLEIRGGYKFVDGWLVGYTENATDEILCVDEIRGVATKALDGCQVIRRFVCSEASKLKTINSQAFRYCTKLETVVLPEGLERIDDEAFIGCTKMANVIVPGSVESVGDRAFKQCTMLTNAQIAHGVKSIGEEAFHSDWRIAEVDIPSTVTNVGVKAFGGDSSIVRAGMRGDICKISEVFSNYEHIREFTVKEGDGEIVDALFEDCRELVAVRIMGDCPKMANDGSNLYLGAGIVEMEPDGNHPEGWINEKATVTYVTEGSTGWDGIPGSEALPQSWPLAGEYRRSISFWDVPTYLCQFDSNGGTLGVQDTYQYSEQKVALPPEPVQSGYSFAGWWTQPVGGLRVTEDTIFIEGVYTYLWAHWVKGHWVFLDPNGGECVHEFVSYVDQSVYGVLPTPVKSGFSFGGWLYNGNVIEPETEINEKADHTLVAQWTANKYKVQYSPNGGVGELVDEDWVYGETKALRRNAFTRAGFDFVGWSTSATATKAQYQDEEPLSSLTAKAGEVVVLYAVWEKNVAVDPTNVAFTCGGYADWQQVSQLVNKADGAHSVATPLVWQSGKIADNQSSILKTKVSGKGKLEFWWRVSCESFRTQKLDHLSFVVDGDEVKWINGNKDWAYVEAEITSGGEHEVVWSYNKDDEGSDGEDCGAVCAVVWTPQLSNLSDYLNADDLTIATTGSADWFGTTEVSHDGAGAAQSGKIGDNQESRLETTVDGSGTIAFWWKVDCESYRTYKLDHVAFLIDGVEQKWINGNKDWMRESFEVSGAGAHTLAWVYAKDEEGSDGEDCAWVDEVVWTAAPKPSRPEVIEGASEEVKEAFDQWVVDYCVSNPSEANVNAFVLGLAPTVTEEAVQKVVEEELQNLDFSKLSGGDISAAVAEIQAKYPNAKVDLAPVEDFNTSARLFKLVIKLK